MTFRILRVRAMILAAAVLVGVTSAQPVAQDRSAILAKELTSLLRIAEQLDDELLLLELERRRLSEESEPAPSSAGGTLVRASLLAILLTALVLTMFGR